MQVFINFMLQLDVEDMLHKKGYLSKPAYTDGEKQQHVIATYYCRT